MIRTVIYRLEGVILNQELLRFKAYEKLWIYMRQDSRWQNFEDILKLRELYLKKRGTMEPYQDIAAHYLEERQLNRFRQEWDLFYRKMSNFYIRAIPGMLDLNKKLNFYYKTAVIGNAGAFFDKAMKKFGLDYNFNIILSQSTPMDESETHSLLQEILRKSRAAPEETVLFSERLHPDISAGEMLGLHTVWVTFDSKTKGFTPQSIRERQYMASLSRVPERLPARSMAMRQPFAVARKPRDLEKIIARLEEGEKLPRPLQPEEEKKQFTLWDIAKEILNIPDFDK
ncbi:MAG: hypothetical protein EH225_05355 [Calditrichaeota bacterium]|nr:HAD hydrolase-like protein [Calditrichota bacterium]RQW04850.1 MAG: hypothetical protein EH225_05355 [Calditrichota bacterium]